MIDWFWALLNTPKLQMTTLQELELSAAFIVVLTAVLVLGFIVLVLKGKIR